MVQITKDSKIVSIPAGSLGKFISAGWIPLNTKESTTKVEKVEHVEPIEEPVPDVEELEEEVEYVDPVDLLDRPLSSLDKDELVILAEYKGISTEGLSSKQLRAAIRSLE